MPIHCRNNTFRYSCADSKWRQKKCFDIEGVRKAISYFQTKRLQVVVVTKRDQLEADLQHDHLDVDVVTSNDDDVIMFTEGE